MDRRELLVLLGGSLTAGLAGCLGDDENQDSDPPDGEDGAGENDTANRGDSPTDDAASEGDAGTDDGGEGTVEIPGKPLSTVESYVAAIGSGDEQRAIALLHEDSDLTVQNVQRDLEFFSGADVTLTEQGLVDFEEDVLTSRGVLAVEREGEDSTRIGLELQLRQASTGQWLIVDGRAVQLERGGQPDGDTSGENQTDGE
jgi:hypothetical protein